MKKIILMMMFALTLTVYAEQDKSYNPSLSEQDADNTGRNVRDRNLNTKTPGNQSESDADRTITQKIRQALVSDSALSTNAKNIKVITIQGVVTLRGPVASVEEKDAIARKISNVQGILKVDNQLEVTRNNY